MPNLLKGLLVVVGATAATTLALFAGDFAKGLPLAGLATDATGPCTSGAVLLNLGDRTLCVDQFEAAPADTCPVTTILRAEDTAANLAAADCRAESVSAKLPWRHVSQNEAQQFCARAGKRLLDSSEWYKLALTVTNQTDCVISADGPATGEDTKCTNTAGITHLIGNVWEWVDGTVTAGSYAGRALPESGYVTLADSDGVVVETAAEPSVTYGEDYAWTGQTEVAGIIRGGFFGSGADAGLYAQNLSVPLDLRVAGVGFRCVQDVTR